MTGIHQEVRMTKIAMVKVDYDVEVFENVRHTFSSLARILF